MSSAEEPVVSVVILNWNRAEDTAECLRSLHAQTFRNWSTIVVDNGSTDDSVARLRSEFPSVEVVPNERNVGFAGGCNVGIRRALAGPAEYVLVLNNDTVLDPQCMDELVRIRPACFGILAPSIYYYAAPDRLWSAGARKRSGLAAKLKARDLWADIVPADYVTGCAMLVRRCVFEAIGLFDERYFMYYEDNDFCARARRAGYEIGVIRRARVWHKVGVSLRDDPPTELYLRMRGALRFYRGELRGWRQILLVLWALNRVFGTLWRDGRRGAWPSVGATLAGIRDGLGAET